MFSYFFSWARLRTVATMAVLSFFACNKDSIPASDTHPAPELARHYPLSLTEAMAWFAEARSGMANNLSGDEFIELDPRWDQAFTGQSLYGQEVLVVPLPDSALLNMNGGRVGVKLLFSKPSPDSILAKILMYVTDSAYYQTSSQVPDVATYTGLYLLYDLGQRFEGGISVVDGMLRGPVTSVVLNVGTQVEDRDEGENWACIEYQTSVLEQCVAVEDCYRLRIITYENCYMTTGGAGSGLGWGSGGNNGGGGAGGGTGGGGSGNNTNPYYAPFWQLFAGILPMNTFLAQGNTLPEGFTFDILKHFVDIQQIYKFNTAQLDTLSRHPGYIEAIFNLPYISLGEGSNRDLVKTILEFAGRYGLSAEQFGFLLNNQGIFTQLESLTAEAGLSSEQVRWLADLDVVPVIEQLNNFIQNNELEFDRSVDEAVDIHLHLLMTDPEYALLNEAAAAWPGWFWDIAADVLVEIGIKIAEKQLGLTIGEDVKDAIRDCGAGDLLGCIGNTIDVLRRFFPALKFIDLTLDGIELGEKANKVWKAVDKLQNFGEAVSIKFWNVLKNRCGNFLDNFHWINNASGASLKNSGDPLSFWDELEGSLIQIPGVTVLTPFELAPYDLAGVQLNYPYGHKISIKYGGNTNPNGYTLVFKLQPSGGEFKIRFD